MDRKAFEKMESRVDITERKKVMLSRDYFFLKYMRKSAVENVQRAYEHWKKDKR